MASSSTEWPVERFAACLRRDLPPPVPDDLDEQIRVGLREGALSGLRREWDLYRLCRYRLLLGDALHQDPRYAALRRELEGDRPDRMDRADYVFYRATRRHP